MPGRFLAAPVRGFGAAGGVLAIEQLAEECSERRGSCPRPRSHDLARSGTDHNSSNLVEGGTSGMLPFNHP